MPLQRRQSSMRAHRRRQVCVGAFAILAQTRAVWATRVAEMQRRTPSTAVARRPQLSGHRLVPNSARRRNRSCRPGAGLRRDRGCGTPPKLAAQRPCCHWRALVTRAAVDREFITARADMVASQSCDPFDEPVPGTVEVAGRSRRRGDINSAHGNKRPALKRIICAEIEADRY